MEEEMNSLHMNKTYKLVELSKGRKVPSISGYIN